jgi:hypothetical protein
MQTLPSTIGLALQIIAVLVFWLGVLNRKRLIDASMKAAEKAAQSKGIPFDPVAEKKRLSMVMNVWLILAIVSTVGIVLQIYG